MRDTSGIDRFFDVVDTFVDKVDVGLNGPKQSPKRTERLEQNSSASRRKSAKDALGASRSTALATRRFRIDEVTDATSGAVIFIVTDGQTARCEFSSRVTAEKILSMLESSP